MNKLQNIVNRAKRFSRQTETGNIKLVLIGGWQDLAAYYAGDDGNAWKLQGNSSFTNCGELEGFKHRVRTGQFRGKIFS